MDVHDLFACRVFGRVLDFDPAPVLALIRKLEKTVPSVHLSNWGGWQSPSQPYFLDHYPECAPLRAAVLAMLGDVGQTLSLSAPLRLWNSWANVNRGAHTNGRHIHTNAYAAGVVYLHAPAGTGAIRFHSPVTRDGNYGYGPAGTHDYAPEVGRCYVFPAWLYHEVLPNEPDQERVSVAFNIMPSA